LGLECFESGDRGASIWQMDRGPSSLRIYFSSAFFVFHEGFKGSKPGEGFGRYPQILGDFQEREAENRPVLNAFKNAPGLMCLLIVDPLAHLNYYRT
jgi:hypothetical protein